MKLKSCLVCFCLITALGFSQREASNWYFGKNAGLNFNSGNPEPLFDGQINTVEGCEAFSDSNGNLLFYTDGKTVWNKNHAVMPNGEGLKGSFSSSQSALVVPLPDNNDLYFIFTPDDALTDRTEESETNGFNYSIVDISRNGGLGEVTIKNEELLSQCSEKVSGVRNSNGNYYWVVTHFKDTFYAYKVDENGVNRNPVRSRVGPSIESFENTRGTIKISPDGTKLAITHTIVDPEFEGSFYLFDFDVETGSVTNPNLISDSRIYYGVEFSSNSSKLYASGAQINRTAEGAELGVMQIVQFNLEEVNFQESEYVVHSFPGNSKVFVAGALQLGIDKKIYHSFPNERLSVIRTPNLSGIDVDFRPFSVSLGDRLATFGLPPFIQSFFETIVTIENFCEGSATTFTTATTGDIAAIRWDFGDPSSGNENSSSELNPSHVFSSFGTYTVTMNVEYNNGSSREFMEFVEIAERPNVVDEVEFIQCDIDGMDDGRTSFNLVEAIPLFNNGNERITALFFDNEADALANRNQISVGHYNNNFNGQVLYARAFQNAECASIVKVTLIAQPLSYLGDYDTVYICNPIIAPLGANVNAKEIYDWLYGDFKDYDELTLYRTKENALFEKDELPLELFWFGVFDPFPYELYFRVEEDNGCTFIGRVELVLSETPEYEELVSVNLCNGQVMLNALEGYENYNWPDGTATTSYLATEFGKVWVEFGSGSCRYTQTFEVLPEPKIDLKEISIQDFGSSNAIEIVLQPEDDNKDFLFSIDGGTTFKSNGTFKNLVPGIYDIVVDSGCNVLKEEVLVGGMPAFFTPNNDGANDRLSLLNPEFFPSYNMSIFNRYGKLLSSFSAQDNGWDGTFGATEMPPDDYWYVLELADGRSVRGYFTLKR